MATSNNYSGNDESGLSKDVLLDFSKLNLKKIEGIPTGVKASRVTFDNNDIQRIENLHPLIPCLQHLSIASNQLVRMIGIHKLINLQILNLSDNSITVIEGLKDLVHLRWLNLGGNKIKSLERLWSNVKLEHLDISRNQLTQIIDITYLKNLKILLLHGNRLTTLRHMQRNLPSGLTVLSLADNQITDLTELSFISHLTSLGQFSIMNNPCVSMIGANAIGCDHRPYIINWFLTLQVLDGYAVNNRESLKAEWLYSQGKGRTYKSGEHEHLIKYLQSVCPLTFADNLQGDSDDKLEKILIHQRFHQQRLQHRPCPQQAACRLDNEQEGAGTSCVESSVSLPVSMVNSWSAGVMVKQEQDLTLEDVTTDEEMLSMSQSYPSPSSSPKIKQNESPKLRNKVVTSNAARRSHIKQQHKHLSWPRAASAESRLVNRGNTATAGRQGSVSCRGDISGKMSSSRIPISPRNNRKLSPAATTAQHTQVTVPTRSPAGVTKTGADLTQTAAIKTGPSNRKRNNQSQVSNARKLQTSKSSSRTYDNNEKNLTSIITPSSNGKQTSVHTHTKCDDKENIAATRIQSVWRGHHERSNNEMLVKHRYETRIHRMEDYIRYLMDQLRRGKQAREEEKKLRSLQLEALEQMWKEIQGLMSWRQEMDILSPREPPGTLSTTGNLNTTAITSGGNSHREPTPSSSTSTITPHTQHTGDVYSEIQVNDLRNNYTSLQEQVNSLQDYMSKLCKSMDDMNQMMKDKNSSAMVDQSVNTECIGDVSDSNISNNVPDSITLKLLSKSDGVSMLKWVCPSSLIPTRLITGYAVYVNGQKMAHLPAEKTAVMLADLDANQSYKFQVECLMEEGKSEISNELVANFYPKISLKQVNCSEDNLTNAVISSIESTRIQVDTTAAPAATVYLPTLITTESYAETTSSPTVPHTTLSSTTTVPHTTSSPTTTVSHTTSSPTTTESHVHSTFCNSPAISQIAGNSTQVYSTSLHHTQHCNLHPSDSGVSTLPSTITPLEGTSGTVEESELSDIIVNQSSSDDTNGKSTLNMTYNVLPESTINKRIGTTSQSQPATPVMTATSSQSQTATSAMTELASESQPVTALKPETSSQSQPVTAASSQPVTAASSQPVTAASSQPVTAASSQPVTAASSQSQPVTAASSQSQPVTAASQSQAATVVMTETSSQSQTATSVMADPPLSTVESVANSRHKPEGMPPSALSKHLTTTATSTAAIDASDNSRRRSKLFPNLEGTSSSSTSYIGEARRNVGNLFPPIQHDSEVD